MADFQHPPLVRDTGDARHINVARPAALTITVHDAQQLVPTVTMGANTVLLFAGVIRFGQDGDSPGEDLSNEANEYAETAGDDTPRTVFLRLHGPAMDDAQFLGSAAFGAFGNVGLTTNDSFGAAVDNTEVQFMQPVEDGNELDRDLWFLSDINTERATAGASEESSIINRLAYHSHVLTLSK